MSEKIACSDVQLGVLRDLGKQLQIKAEKMRLLARAEEGLDDVELNPYSSSIAPEIKLSENITTESSVRYKQTQSNILQQNQSESKIPVSAPRQRRRNRKVKPGSMGQATVDIKLYRPGYTWNRGGRMKEIRIRNVARKFLHVWKRKVFGRVTPSQAREHYRRRLLRQTFWVWHEMWWVLRKEWRLIIRAECHHRYVLWRRTFKMWKDFILQQRIKNAKVALAERHTACRMTRKCIMGWWLYVHGRREKNKGKRQAVLYYRNQLLRRCWLQWVCRYELVLHRNHMETVALQFWAFRIQAQYWLTWQVKLSDNEAVVMKQYRAVRHCNTVTVCRCFRAWILYWARCRQKAQEKDHCERIYLQSVLNRAFLTWHTAFVYRDHVNQRQDRLTTLAQTFQKRWMFVHWKHYIDLQKEKYEMIAEAENHYRSKLLSAGFSSFRLCVVQKHLKFMRTEMANRMRYKRLTQWGWLTWLSRCENKAELRMVTQSHLAWKHYRFVISRKCFTQLHVYAEWRQYRQVQYATADAHFYMQAMPKYMFRLKVFVQLMKNKREHTRNATEFRRENARARCFYGWMNQYEASKEYRMNERMAILHYDEKLSKRFFNSWKQKTADALEEADNEEIATDHHNEALCRKYLQLWRLYIYNIKKSGRQDVEASRYYYRRIMKTCIHAWIIYTRQKREKKLKTERAMNHHNRRLCQKMVAMWLHYVDTQRAIHAQVDIMYARKCSHFFREAFQMWRETVTQLRLERHTQHVADRQYTIKILAKIFTAWHRFSAIHAYKKSETQQWVVSARQHLDTKVLQIYFLKWRSCHVEHVHMRLNNDRASDHHSVKVKQQVMVAWQQFIKESIRKSLLQKQCDWFHNVRLTVGCFCCWKHAYNGAQAEKQQSSLALWHWCLSLHRKVIMAWYVYTLQRKHKKSRVQAAMERRQCRLIKNGLTQWLRVADDMSAMRKQFAVQQHAKNAFETYQVVLRCGLHWKAWASKCRQTRGAPKPLTIPRNEIAVITRADKSGRKMEMGDRSVSSTPRFTSSLFNTRSDMAYVNLTSDEPHPYHPGCEPQLSAPVLSASPPTSMIKYSGIPQIGGHAQSRARPRQPSFLMESLKRAGIFVHDTRSEQPHDPPTIRNKPTSQADTVVIERLNLSNLTTNLSDLESDRTTTPHISQPQHNVITSARSDKTGPQLSVRVPFQDHENTREPVIEAAPSSGNHLQPNFLSSGVVFTPGMNSYGVRQDLSSQNVSKLTLMTPADFLCNTGVTESYAVRKEPNITPRILSGVGSLVVSESPSVASTPRVLCQDSNHSHPLSETRSFRVTDFAAQVTPRSTSSVTPSEQSTSLGFETHSTQMIQREIVTIRNTLKSYDQKKKKLRTMQKQLKQLCDWLKDVEVKGQISDDDDVTSAKQEVQELSADVNGLKRTVEEEKIQCASLVNRVRVLTSQLAPLNP